MHFIIDTVITVSSVLIYTEAFNGWPPALSHNLLHVTSGTEAVIINSISSYDWFPDIPELHITDFRPCFNWCQSLLEVVITWQS